MPKYKITYELSGWQDKVYESQSMRWQGVKIGYITKWYKGHYIVSILGSTKKFKFSQRQKINSYIDETLFNFEKLFLFESMFRLVSNKNVEPDIVINSVRIPTGNEIVIGTETYKILE